MPSIALHQLEGKYEILGKLRQGGMGAIYKVRHRLLGDIRVIKVMRPRLVDDPILSKRFLQEARNAIRLSHPNIAQLYDYTLSDDGTAYIVMEFIQGVTFQQLLERSLRPPIGLGVEIAVQALRAIGHLHQHGVIHRDISPDNLMLGVDVDDRPLVKLIDLGIAKTVGADAELTDAGVFVGKLRYAAPEQFDERGDSLTPACDLYGFSIVLYELLTGRYPIVGSGPSSLIAGHLFRPPLGFSDTDPDGRVPDPIRAAILRGLEKTPRDRFSDASSFSTALTSSGVVRGWDDAASTDIIALTQRGIELGDQSSKRAAPGSTQGRLDVEFAAEPTPPPGRQTEPSSLPSAKDPPGEETAAIEGRISGGDYSSARALLTTAFERHGRSDRLDELDRRISEMERIDLRAQLQELIARAAEHSADHRHDLALEPLVRANELDPDNERIQELLSDARLAAYRSNDSAATTRLVDQRADAITTLISDGDRSAAVDALREASAVFGPTRSLATLEDSISAAPTVAMVGALAQAESVSAETVDQLVTQAHQLAQHEDFDVAESILKSALRASPDHTQATALISAVRSCSAIQQAEKNRELAVDEKATGIRALLDEGKTQDAIKTISSTIDEFGSEQELQNLRYRATQQELEETQRGTLEGMVEAIEHRRSEGDTGAAMALLQRAQRIHGAVDQLKTLRQKLGEELLIRETREISVGDRMPFDRVSPATELDRPRRRHKVESALASSAAEPRRPPIPEHRPGRKMLGASVAVVALAAILYFAAQLDFANLISPSTVEAPAVVVADLPPGFLLFDCQPWGEIVSIVDSTSGEEVPIAPSRFSPVRLSLPVGTFHIVFSSIFDDLDHEIDVTIVSGEVTTERWLARATTVDDYFGSLGW